MSGPGETITVALVDDVDLVRRGLRDIMAGHPSLRFVEWDPRRTSRPVDIVLHDAFAPGAGGRDDVEELRGRRGVGRLVVYSWDADRARVSEALRAGADGFLAKGLGADALVVALVRVHHGERVVARGPEPGGDEEAGWPAIGRDWPGRGQGLTCREAEVVGLISQGLSNQEIATRLYLSINSVKSYIRTAYRKMQVERRSQALLWALDHGLDGRVHVEVHGAA